MRVMRIAVIGAGGVGGYFGGRLAAGGHEVIFVVRGRTLEALRARGLRVDSIRGDFTVNPVQATDDPSSIGPVDAVLVAVKSWQLAEAAAIMKPLIAARTIVVPLLNGMEAPEILSGALGSPHVLGGLCGIVSFIVEPGHIRHAATEPFVMFGELDQPTSARAERLREAFAQSGVQADVAPDIVHAMWSKFLFITPMSAIGALTRLPIGEWRSQPETREVAVLMLREMTEIALRRGVRLSDDAIDRILQRFDALPPESTSSLQRDVMNGLPSELDAQLGAVLRMAGESGSSAPVCEMLYALLLPQERRARQDQTSGA